MSDLYEQTNNILQQLTTLVQSPKPVPPYKSFAQTLNGTNEVPDEIVPTDDDLPEPNQSLLPSPAQSPIGFELWEALAYDLALDHTPREQIAEAYSLNLEQLDHLSSNHYFVKMLKTKKDEVAQLGSDAAFTVKMRMVANRATPQFMQRLTNPATSTREFHALFKTAVELAQLMPQPDRDDPQPTAVIGASVTFNIQGVPGLDHLTATASTDSTDTSDDIIDATFSEIVSRQDQSDDLQEL